MTKEEKWFRRLERCIKAMPDNVEIAIANGSITMLPMGAVDRCFDKYGDVDHFADEYLDSFTCKRVNTCSESL